MPEIDGFILGFDPGGKGSFGWSICRASNGHLQQPLETGLADDALDALLKVKQKLGRYGPSGFPPVLAAGIDAPLFWSKKGDRTVDVVLQQALTDTKFPDSKLRGTVQAVNSLRGACVVQGLLLAKYLGETSWSLTITESHPRALCHLLHQMGKQDMIKRLTGDLADYAQYATRCLCGCEEAKKPKASLDDHRRDATLSAISAWAAIQPTQPKWQNLYDESKEPHRIMPFDTPVSYWMPIPKRLT